MLRTVFVYGTLKPGEKNHGVALSGGQFRTREAYLEGMVLYDLQPEGYPAMLRGEGRVYGVILDYNDIGWALPFLDSLEGLDMKPPLYERVQAVAQPLGETVWTYLYARHDRLEGEGVSKVANGIWKARH